MKITVKENRKLIIINPQNTQNENEIETIELIVPTKYESWNKKIAFVTNDKVIWGLFENNLYQIPSSVTQYKKLKFYIWMTKDDKDFRSEEKILILNENHPVTGEVTPKDKSDIEQVIDTLEAEIDKVENIDITVQKIGNTATITITDKTGNEKSVNILDGNDGQTGPTGPAGRGISSITKTSTSGLVDTYTINYTSGNPTTYTVTNGAKRRYRCSR